MVRQPFEGTVAFLFGESGEAVREITVALRHPAPAADAGPRASVDGADIAGPLETTRGSAGPWGWVTVETDLRLLTEPDARDLVLEFRDPDGRVVARLPDATPDRAPAFRPVAVRHALPSSSPADEHP